jgi:hypothetical protein
MLEKGRGVQKDLARADAAMTLAGVKHEHTCENRRGELETRMTPDELNRAKKAVEEAQDAHSKN